MRAGKIGRREERRRLADPVSNMADEIMADVSEDRNLQNRPLHHAYLRCKLPCPYIECRGDARKVFLEEKGLAQHFRIKHARVIFDNVKQVTLIYSYYNSSPVQVRKNARKSQYQIFDCFANFSTRDLPVVSPFSLLPSRNSLC